jgi:hypothetical protein
MRINPASFTETVRSKVSRGGVSRGGPSDDGVKSFLTYRRQLFRGRQNVAADVVLDTKENACTGMKKIAFRYDHHGRLRALIRQLLSIHIGIELTVFPGTTSEKDSLRTARRPPE